MFCSKCGKAATFEAQFCASCGSKLTPSQQVETPIITSTDHAGSNLTLSTPPVVAAKSGVGFGITGLIFGILALAYGFSDYGAISDGSYSYIMVEEIGILAILSIIGIVFGSVSAARKSSIGSWALIISILALLFTFFLAQFSA